MTALSDALDSAGSTCDEARWLTDPRDPSAVETLRLLEESLQTLPDAKRSRVIKEIERGDANHVIATLREVIAYEWLRRLSLNPNLWPGEYTPLTPDLSFEIDSKTFLADVFVSSNPSRTILYKSKDCLGTKDSGERAQKIADRLAQKYVKYRSETPPIVFFVFHGDHIIRSRDAEIALYGASIGDLNLIEDFPWQIRELHPPGGFFLPNEDGTAKHERVSAVVWCDWFDTENQDLPGKRLRVVVYHHWEASAPIAPGAFGPFPELVWNEVDNSWQHRPTAELNLVARFTEQGQFDVRAYSSDEPW